MSKVVGHLMKLGLTEYEARVYIATVALGEGTIKAISAESGVPRSRTYDVLERLAEKGMVEAGSSSPRCYRANEPITVSNKLMEDLRRNSDEILGELNRISRTAETRENPIWTVKGEWAIDHKVSDILERAKDQVTILGLTNTILIRYARMIAQHSQGKGITVVLCHQPESFIGLLGRSRVMRINPIPGFLGNDEGVLNEKGFVTKDEKYCIELVIHSDSDESLLVTKEGEDRRAIFINGTILNFFSHQTLEQVVRSAEDVVHPATTGKKAPARSRS
jgi:sugar-specific transcriptional regulator TrmB